MFEKQSTNAKPPFEILPDIDDCIVRAAKGHLNPFWQKEIELECDRHSLSNEEQQALLALHRLLSLIPQWSDEAALQKEISDRGGHVLFCKYFSEHRSVAELVQDSDGLYSITFILDAHISPAERKIAAQEVQKLLSEKMKKWNIVCIRQPLSEKPKYESLTEAASELMQLFDKPEMIRF